VQPKEDLKKLVADVRQVGTIQALQALALDNIEEPLLIVPKSLVLAEVGAKLFVLVSKYSP
jgi:hypothetical protein